MKICAIDIGTNSVLCLYAEITKHQRLSILSFRTRTTRLGESLNRTGILKKSAQTRTLNALKTFIRSCPSNKYILAGTSALREAKNTKTFLAKVLRETGHRVHIISAKKEAQMVFGSVKYFLSLKAKNILICDIGGGSTEFILCKNSKIIRIASLPIGTVKLKEWFGKNYGLGERFTERILRSKITRFKVPSFICVGGTATTLAVITKGLKKYDTNKINKIVLSLPKIEKVFLRLSFMKLPDIKQLIPFDPKRADIIIPGILILKTVMRQMGIKKVKICDRGLVYGLALNCFIKHGEIDPRDI